MNEAKKEVTSHVLDASANLIGICFVVITGLKITGLADSTIVDEIAAATAVAFLVASLFAYLAMRRESIIKDLCCAIADYAFLAGLLSLTLTISLLALDIIK